MDSVLQIIVVYLYRPDENSEPAKPKPAPKKLNIDWAAKTKERASIKEDAEPVGLLIISCNVCQIILKVA